MNSYLLLRNNKESGPYSAEQLIKNGLKPYDLVWLEGRSTAWRYPSEVEELKPYAPVVEEQPFDRFYKPNTTQQQPGVKTVEEALPVKKEKPRFRVAAAWNKIDAAPQPVAVETKQEVVLVTTPSWKEVYTEWKAEEPAPKAPVSPPKKEPVQLETKYSQSLDEIKERYAETVLKPKVKKGFNLSVNAKQAGEVAMIMLVIAFGLWMVFKPDAKENNALAAKTTEVKQQEKPVLADEQPADESAGNEDNANSNTVRHEEKPLQNDNVQKQEGNSPVYVTVDKKPNLVKPQAKKPAQTIPVRFASNELPAQKNQKLNVSTQPVAGVRNNVKRVGSTQLPQNVNGAATPVNNDEKQVAANAATAPVVKNTPSKKTVDELVRVEQVSRYPGVVQDVKLNVQNMTGSVLDLVVVDLKYYDKKGFYKKGETLYIKNLPANRDVIIKAPDDLGASNVTYKVGLVSSAQNGMSMVAD